MPTHEGHLCRLRRRRIAEVSDVLVDEDGARRDGRRILKQAELGNVRAWEKLDEPVELGSDGLDAFRKADRVVEDRVGGVYLICFLPGAISERGPHTKGRYLGRLTTVGLQVYLWCRKVSERRISAHIPFCFLSQFLPNDQSPGHEVQFMCR